MNLDDLQRFKQLDKSNMLGEIESLPDQLAKAWQLGQAEVLPTTQARIARVVIAGMGGSAIGADLVAAWAAQHTRVPIITHRDYGLPAFAAGPETLLVASSHSGNTEETLDAFDEAVRRSCTVVAISTGGKLSERAAKAGVPVWKFAHSGQPRAAVGFSYGLLLALLHRLGLIPEPSSELNDALKAMRDIASANAPAIVASKNPAKRYAGQLVDRWVTIFGSGVLAPVARRIKGQINELAKASANFEFLPEADHNALAATLQPESVLSARTMNLFLRSESDHPRNRKRTDLTKQTLMLAGQNTDFIDARGSTPMGQMWSVLLFGDYMAYYLAMAYGTDPTPVDVLAGLKSALAQS